MGPFHLYTVLFFTIFISDISLEYRTKIGKLFTKGLIANVLGFVGQEAKPRIL